jgi:hypothetical protein
MTGNLSVQVEGFKPLRSNTLYGFCDIAIPEMLLRIFDLTVHEKNGKRWASLPSKPQITREGTARKDRGKTAYSPVLEFTGSATRSAFSDRVIASLLEFAPAAFDDTEAA